MDVDRRMLVLRAVAGLAVLLLVPAILVMGTLSDEGPIRVGEPSPREIVNDTDRAIEIRDDDATEEARETARNSVEPVTVIDNEAREEAILEVQSVFAAVRAARTPVEITPPAGSDETTEPQTRVPTPEAQVQQLTGQVELLDEEGLRELVSLTDTQLARVENETVDVLQELLRQEIAEGEVETVLNTELGGELSLRSWPGAVRALVAEPLIRATLRPTVTIDNEQTEAQRDAAAEAVEPQFEVWEDGEVIVDAGEEVTEVQLRALEQIGEAGSEAGVAFLRALVATLLVVAISALYLQRVQPLVWRDPARLFVLSSLVVLTALTLVAVEILADTFGTGWFFAFPVAGIVLLVSVLVSPQVGTMSVLPLAGLSMLVAPGLPALSIFVAGVVVLAAPIANRISTRVGLRKASVRTAAAVPLIAAAVALVFGPRDQYDAVVGAAVLGGIAGAGILQGLLPAFENVFRLTTVTALLDLADRNHPLLRELEAKAIGSYNHSVMVASLTERCCREIGANHLLGQVAALYHDIGKVRQPHFFIENQRGIANPHDDLEPRVSAVIIQNHVKDGVEMAERHRLPPEVVSCIGSHHGTMLVTYFYRQAIAQAGGDEDAVDEQHFRYKGHKPRSKEAAVLLMADCCEATTRAMAMDRGTLPGDEIEQVVDKLLHERVEDGQFDDCELTFVELQRVRDTLVDALTGIYHPRIQYPGQRGGPRTLQ